MDGIFGYFKLFLCKFHVIQCGCVCLLTYCGFIFKLFIKRKLNFLIFIICLGNFLFINCFGKLCFQNSCIEFKKWIIFFNNLSDDAVYISYHFIKCWSY